LINIFEEITKLLSDEKRVVLARIVRQTGSAPRSLGTKFLVLEDASIIGTIGGGSLEHQVIRLPNQKCYAAEMSMFFWSRFFRKTKLSENSFKRPAV
jgi:xanthine/CO dehydrogenase XdhC/CoxF family maturation factor